MLWRPADDAAGNSPQLVLIDPVSVAGVTRGPPLFDLVKYESYATGELLALRSEWVDLAGFDGRDEYRYRVCWESAVLAPFEGSIGTRAFAAPSKPSTAPSIGARITSSTATSAWRWPSIRVVPSAAPACSRPHRTSAPPATASLDAGRGETADFGGRRIVSKQTAGPPAKIPIRAAMIGITSRARVLRRHCFEAACLLVFALASCSGGGRGAGSGGIGSDASGGSGGIVPTLDPGTKQSTA